MKLKDDSLCCENWLKMLKFLLPTLKKSCKLNSNFGKGCAAEEKNSFPSIFVLINRAQFLKGAYIKDIIL